MPSPLDGVHDAHLYDLDPETVLERDPRVLLEPSYLSALHGELLAEGGPELTKRFAVQIEEDGKSCAEELSALCQLFRPGHDGRTVLSSTAGLSDATTQPTR
jgi:hypothetical protein